MKENTKKRKKSIAGMKEVYGKEEMVNQMYRILVTGKQGFDTLCIASGSLLRQKWYNACKAYLYLI